MKEIPNSLEVERAALGHALESVEGREEIKAKLEPSDFHSEANRMIFQEILEADGKPLDYVLLCDSLEQKGVLERIGGASYVAKLLSEFPQLDSAEGYCKRLRDLSCFRRLRLSRSTSKAGARQGMNRRTP